MATDSRSWDSPASVLKFRRAVWLGMIAMTMFFLGLTFAYVVRHGLTIYWLSPELATILAANTFVLLGSSVALWRARQYLGARLMRGTLRWTGMALLLGVLFLAGQGLAWYTLFAQGVYITGHPNSGFFYVVTAAHAFHIVLALGLLSWVFSRAWRGRLHADRPLLMDLTSIIWHCLDLTWVYLFLVLLFYR
ncbi:MAG: cytochrome c oxidase subunit 3 [Terriglobales bacterium]